MAKAGRPWTYTEEIGERIVESFWSGECRSLNALLKKDWAPSNSALYRWTKKFPDFGEALREARIASAEYFVGENDEIVADMLAGTIDPTAANVAINWNKWKAGMSNPENYGAKTQINTNSTLKVTTEYVHRIPLDGLSEEARDAIEVALGGTLLLTGPDADSSSAGQD